MPIHLRPTISQDLDFVLTAENHPDNRNFVSQWTSEQHKQAIATPNALHFIIEADSVIVGYAMLHGLTDPNQSLCIQRLVITQKGYGYGKATLRLLQKRAFEEWYTHRLWLDVKDYNHRAKHVYESVGFHLEGVIRECVKKDDRFESIAIFSILKSEYLTIPKAQKPPANPMQPPDPFRPENPTMPMTPPVSQQSQGSGDPHNIYPNC